MKIRSDDYTYGCRSGIQKAIRRGDLDLAYTCFETLWEVKKHRQWLTWRATVLVTEEAWQMIGELVTLVKSEKDKPPNKNAWRSFIYKLTLCTKNKDAVGLWFLVDAIRKTTYNHPEHEIMRKYHNMMQGFKMNPASVAGPLFDELYREDMSNYEKGALRHLRIRTDMGGMYADRCINLSAMILVAYRGLNPKAIKEDIKAGKEKWRKRAKVRSRKPKKVPLPWYVFDMHTVAGKIARTIFMRRHAKKYKISEYKFDQAWFHIESARIAKGTLNIRNDNLDLLTMFDCAWWLPLLRLKLPFGKHTAKQVKELWESKIRKDIKSCVEWILEKRHEDEKKGK